MTSQALQSRNNARQGMTRDFALIDSGMQTDRVCAYVKEAATACPLDNPFPFFFCLAEEGARTPLTRCSRRSALKRTA